jgi:hypothetical protein
MQAKRNRSDIKEWNTSSFGEYLTIMNTIREKMQIFIYL